jgi:chlorobactene glucosyltransferase
MEVLLYITFAFLTLRLAVAFFNSITASGLEFAWRGEEERISVLIPARNEEATIPGLLKEISVQDYKNIEVLVLDDLSTDNTFAVVNEFSANDNRFRCIPGKELPDGWLGKNWACHQLAQNATGSYFLFLDADVSINGPLFSGALYKMQQDRLSLLSLFPGQIMKGAGEWLVVPLMHYLLLTLLPLRFIEWSKHPAFAAANGQFMLFDAAKYRMHQWHLQVKHKVTEDIEIMKEVKRHGLKGATLLENNLIRCRMYNSFPEAVLGFQKNLLAGFGGNVAGVFLYLYLTIFSYALYFICGEWQLFLIAAFMIVFLRSLISGMAEQNPLWNVLLHIPQLMVMIYIVIRSVTGKIFKTTQWKGRKIFT